MLMVQTTKLFNISDIKTGKFIKGRSSWNSGMIMSDEYKEKLSLAHLGIPSPRKGCKISEEHKLKLKEAWVKRKINGYVSPLKGVKTNKKVIHSEETKRKISEKALGRVMTEEVKIKISETKKVELDIGKIKKDLN